MESSESVNHEEFSVAIPAALNLSLSSHLLRADGQEDVAFALYKPSSGSRRFTSLVHEVLLPKSGERNVHGNATINPRYFKRVCEEALKKKSGIAMLHSHPATGWQGTSSDDFKTEKNFASTAFDITELPFVGLTLAQDNVWSARVWEHNNGWYVNKMAAAVRVVGKRLHVFHNDALRPLPEFKEMYKRTVTVWGAQNHACLARLRVGIVGLGSVGSMVAECLARMGVERFVLIDFDEVQTHNLDRLTGASAMDVGQLKAQIAQRQILKNATASKPDVSVVPFGVTEVQGYENALDCDVLFSCVDRPWPRHVLNHIAYHHLIPVVDGGIKVMFDQTTSLFEGADWQALTVGPERICLKCAGQYNIGDVGTEREGQLDNPTYMEGLPEDHLFKRNENVFPFSMNVASLEVLQMVEMVSGIGEADGYYGLQRYMYNQGFIRRKSELACENGCFFVDSVALGDSKFQAPVGKDFSAYDARARQQS